jgi:hypothetical protein
MDIYELFSRYKGIQKDIFSYFNKYEDNILVFRILSKNFTKLDLYDILIIQKLKNKNQTKSYIKNFLFYNNIKKLYIHNFNKKLLMIDSHLYSNLKKITIESFSEKDFYFFTKYFSKLPIQNLKLLYLKFKYPNILCEFKNLIKLDIHITMKENEDIIFELLKINKNTLRKLKIGIYTGKNIDKQKLKSIIESDLKLENIDIRNDLFSYKMIHPMTKKIHCIFPYNTNEIYTLKYLIYLRMHSVKNNDLKNIFNILEYV